jgi:hypothetical protein
VKTLNAIGCINVPQNMLKYLLSAGLMALVTTIALSGTASSISMGTVNLPAPARWLTKDASSVYALLENGNLVRSDGAGVTNIATGWSQTAPIRFAHGRLHGISKAGELLVLESNRLASSTGAKLSLEAGLLPLPAGVIAVAANGDLLRLEPRGDTWQVVARNKLNALLDVRLTLADLQGDNDGEVVALVNPNRDRYQHGVLGDTLEATSILGLERHSLEVLWRYDLPSPFVFEDLTLRPVKLGTRDQLVVVRSSSKAGAALALVRLDKNKLELTTGPEIGQANRWLNPLVGPNEIYAIHTPHLGGVLHKYTSQGNALQASKQLTGITNHVIGSRNLEPATVFAPGRLIAPSQDQQQLQSITCSSRCEVSAKYALRSGRIRWWWAQRMVSCTSGDRKRIRI